MPNKYPDGWREIVSIGDSVEGTNFIPFKVPYRGPWTLSTLKRRKPEVKFIIDMCAGLFNFNQTGLNRPVKTGLNRLI